MIVVRYVNPKHRRQAKEEALQVEPAPDPKPKTNTRPRRARRKPTQNDG